MGSRGGARALANLRFPVGLCTDCPVLRPEGCPSQEMLMQSRRLGIQGRCELEPLRNESCGTKKWLIFSGPLDMELGQVGGGGRTVTVQGVSEGSGSHDCM